MSKEGFLACIALMGIWHSSNGERLIMAVIQV